MLEYRFICIVYVYFKRFSHYVELDRLYSQDHNCRKTTHTITNDMLDERMLSMQFHHAEKVTNTNTHTQQPCRLRYRVG